MERLVLMVAQWAIGAIGSATLTRCAAHSLLPRRSRANRNQGLWLRLDERRGSP